MAAWGVPLPAWLSRRSTARGIWASFEKHHRWWVQGGSSQGLSDSSASVGSDMLSPLLSVAILVVLPHVYALWAWTQGSSSFGRCARWLGVEPLSLFSYGHSLLRTCEYAGMAWWYWRECQMTPPGVLVVLSRAALWQWAACALLSVAGQALNAGIFRTIGSTGVYYGARLGHRVAWQTGFPFNLGLRHPQYIGLVLNMLGVVALLYTEAHAHGLAVLMSMYCAATALTAWSEDAL
jgi:hypothetical protein